MDLGVSLKNKNNLEVELANSLEKVKIQEERISGLEKDLEDSKRTLDGFMKSHKNLDSILDMGRDPRNKSGLGFVHEDEIQLQIEPEKIDKGKSCCLHELELKNHVNKKINSFGKMEKRRCFYCSKIGHLKKDCFFRKRNLSFLN